MAHLNTEHFDVTYSIIFLISHEAISLMKILMEFLTFILPE